MEKIISEIMAPVVVTKGFITFLIIFFLLSILDITGGRKNGHARNDS